VESAIRETGAAASALVAYLTTVLPQARQELKRLGPLPEAKARNAEAVAVFAILAPRSARPVVTRAVTRLQVAIDLRDITEEQGPEGPLDDRLAQRLESGWRAEVAKLPSYTAVSSLLDRTVERCEEGQRQTHAAATGNANALRDWALSLGALPDYRWWEVAAGASSSVAAHALIAAAADPATTAETATLNEAAYHPPIGALTVLLDDLVDRAADQEAGEHNYIAYYERPAEAAERVAWIAGEASRRIESLPWAGRHRAILAGVGAFYLSAAEDRTYASTARGTLLASLGPGMRVLTAFMRGARLLERERRRPGQAGNPPGP
jgi:hypothetical protein